MNRREGGRELSGRDCLCRTSSVLGCAVSVGDVTCQTPCAEATGWGVGGGGYLS